MRRQRTFRPVVESLEERRMLAGGGLVEVGSQPVGALTGKIVYAHAGHGWTADNLGSGAWNTQRPTTFEMVEDLGNQDQTPYFAEYLFNAGATVAALRPIGHQSNEVVLDNDDPEVTFVGSWNDSGASVYYGAPSDVPYRFATKSATETAYARYRPDITTPGFYPVYTWVTSGSNRVDDQLYRINHSGGITEVTVNHQQVGGGTVYLGTYYFDSGTDGYVDVSNRSNSSGGSVVIADMIRFGNGMGDINRGAGVSGKPREDESGLYWVKWHVDRAQGISDTEYRTSSSDRTAAVTFSPRYAEYMNNASVGSLSDRVFISFHSNAGGGNARGVLGLYNGNNTPSSATPNQFELANIIGREVNDDLVDQAGQFEFDWFDRGSSVTLDRSDIEFGEINNTYAQNEFDATIIETGFHDNTLDALMLRDPRVRDALGRASYQGVVKYFNFVDNGSTPVVMLPGRVSNLHAEVVDSDSVEVTWDGPAANSYDGDAATGYRVYVSTDGYGFDGGRFVAATGGTESLVIDGLDSSETFYFKVTAVNAGGESPGSEVLTARPGSDAKVLVVNGFDRLGRALNPREDFFTTEIDRVKQRFSNSRDYSVQVGTALEFYADDLSISGSSNEAVIAGDVVLEDFDAVIWITGEESSADDTFNLTEQALVSNYLAGDGRLFVTGAEIGWDLDNLNNGRSFYENQLRANYASDDANTYSVQGTVSGIFAGLNFDFDDGTLFYDSQFPDVINPNSGSIAALSYVGGIGGTAAVQYTHPSGYGQLVNFGFPFETITSELLRAVVMQRVLDFFALPSISGDFDGNGLYECDDVDALVAAIVEVKGGGTPDLAFDLTGDGDVSNADLEAWLEEAGAAGLTASGNPVLLGDANLDGVVDGQDFISWNTHKFTTTGAWCQADFDANGITDGQDFIIWNTNKFTSADDASLVSGVSQVRVAIQWEVPQRDPQGDDGPAAEVSTPEGNARVTPLVPPPAMRTARVASVDEHDATDERLGNDEFTEELSSKWLP